MKLPDGCPECGNLVNVQPDGTFYPHFRYVDGGGPLPGQDHSAIPCEGGGRSPVMEFTRGQVTDDMPGTSQGSLGSRLEYTQRVLSRQLDDKLTEIQKALGLTGLQMMEVVAHWMQHTARELRDAEAELERT